MDKAGLGCCASIGQIDIRREHHGLVLAESIWARSNVVVTNRDSLICFKFPPSALTFAHRRYRGSRIMLENFYPCRLEAARLSPPFGVNRETAAM